jgi:hypothetical protein
MVRKAGMRCPHCKSVAFIRTSKEVHPLMRELFFQCQSVACGHTFKVTQEIVATVSPSAMPDPEITAILERTATVQRHTLTPEQHREIATLQEEAEAAERLRRGRMRMERETDGPHGSATTQGTTEGTMQ